MLWAPSRQSYLGVCLVLALDLIAETARQSGHAVGPIVILSYKNHALDEFLCDVLTLSHRFQLGQLIRTGKPEHSELQPYSERFSYAEREAENSLVRKIAVERHAKKNGGLWRECAQALTEGFQTQVTVLYCAVL